MYHSDKDLFSSLHSSLLKVIYLIPDQFLQNF